MGGIAVHVWYRWLYQEEEAMRLPSDIWKEPCMLATSVLLQICDKRGLVLARK